MRLKLILLLAILLSSSLFTQAQTGFQVPQKPQPYVPVNDFDNILDPALVQTYNQTLSDYYKKTGRSICVITIPTLGGMDIETAAIDTFRAWGIGDKQGPSRDMGLLLLVVFKERKWRIETGYGNEGDLPDGKAGEILRNNKHFMASKNPTEAVRGVINELAAHFDQKDKEQGRGVYGSGIVTQKPPPTTAEKVVGIIILVIFVLVALFVLIMVIAFFYSLATGTYRRSSSYSGSSSGSGGSGWGSGGGSSGSSSSGGDGGGSSGGGGASDSW